MHKSLRCLSTAHRLLRLATYAQNEQACTQEGLAERLDASRRAVAEWEGGLSYPQSERLKQLITLGMQQKAFPAGSEEEEIRVLWKAAHQKVLLDEAWLQDLLAPAAPVLLSPRAGTPAAPADLEPASFPRVNLVEALDTSHFAGREVEVAELSQWIVQEPCRLVTLLGMGGIGKSMLASYLGLRLAPHFEAVLWRSLRDAPSCEELVADCITFFSETPPAEFPTSLEQRITQAAARLLPGSDSWLPTRAIRWLSRLWRRPSPTSSVAISTASCRRGN